MALTALLARTLATAVVAVASAQTAMAQTPLPEIGVVIMHGKRGSPAGVVSNLAFSLEERGYLVANLEMPWSRNREYDVSVAAAENEVDAALRKLRDQGARKVFVIGYSQGGRLCAPFRWQAFS